MLSPAKITTRDAARCKYKSIGFPCNDISGCRAVLLDFRIILAPTAPPSGPVRIISQRHGLRHRGGRLSKRPAACRAEDRRSPCPHLAQCGYGLIKNEGPLLTQSGRAAKVRLSRTQADTAAGASDVDATHVAPGLSGSRAVVWIPLVQRIRKVNFDSQNRDIPRNRDFVIRIRCLMSPS